MAQDIDAALGVRRLTGSRTSSACMPASSATNTRGSLPTSSIREMPCTTLPRLLEGDRARPDGHASATRPAQVRA